MAIITVTGAFEQADPGRSPAIGEIHFAPVLVTGAGSGVAYWRKS